MHPNMVRRGGGARSIELRDGASDDSLVVHLLVDTCDAMGANLVNSQCEAIAPVVAELTGGGVGPQDSVESDRSVDDTRRCAYPGSSCSRVPGIRESTCAMRS